MCCMVYRENKTTAYIITYITRVHNEKCTQYIYTVSYATRRAHTHADTTETKNNSHVKNFF